MGSGPDNMGPGQEMCLVPDMKPRPGHEDLGTGHEPKARTWASGQDIVLRPGHGPQVKKWAYRARKWALNQDINPGPGHRLRSRTWAPSQDKGPGEDMDLSKDMDPK